MSAVWGARMELVVTVPEVCAILRRSRAHVYRLIAAGKLRTVEPGRVAVESLQAYCAPPAARAPRRSRTGYVPFTRDDVR